MCITQTQHGSIFQKDLNEQLHSRHKAVAAQYNISDLVYI